MALLQDDFWPALFRDDISCGSTIDTHAVPSRSDHIAACFLELERLNQELKSKLRDDFVNILNDMSSISLASTPQPPSPSPTPPSRSSSLTHGSSFITEAYSWLLGNIANPYPSPTVKSSLAQRHNSSLSAINSWFVNARRRIGWTTLCRNHFSNCRADALDAAYRALVKEDLNRPLPADIIHAFISVKAAAEELYSSILTKSALANDLDAVVKDMSDQEGLVENKRNRGGPEGTMELPKTRDVDPQLQKRVAENCYPSPDHSPSSSPVPALDVSLAGESEADEDIDISPPTLAGRKRRFSSSEEPHAPIPESTPRLMKRLRLTQSISSLANTCLPSPATSAEEFSENDQTQPAAQSLINSEFRERCLSDVDTTSLRKHQQDSMAEPRSFLDSLSLSAQESEHAIDEWFKTNFDTLFTFPPPVDVAEPDHSTQWEVKLFNNYTLPEDPQKALTPSTQDNQTFSSTDLIALEDMLQSLERGGFVGLPDLTYPTMASVPGPAAKDFSLLPDLSQSIDWTTLLNGDPLDSANAPLFPHSYVNSVLSEIDLSILQLPQVWTTVAP